MNDAQEQPTIWSIRFTQQAFTYISAAWRYFADTAGEDNANAWELSLRAEIAKLAQYPARLSVIPEDNLFVGTVRCLLYRRTRRGQGHRVLFVLREWADDAPTVAIIHVRHSAQAPMTAQEAREIEASQ